MKGLPATQPVMAGDVEAGIEVWRDTNAHELSRRIYRATAREEAVVLRRRGDRNKYGQYTVLVKRLRPAAPPRARYSWKVRLVWAGIFLVYVGIGVVGWLIARG